MTVLPPVDERDPPEAGGALEPRMRRWSAIAVTAILAAVVLGSLGFLLWSTPLEPGSGAGR